MNLNSTGYLASQTQTHVAVIVLKPPSDPNPCYIPEPVLQSQTRLFLLAKPSREDAVGTHSNRERCRHWVQATDKTALTHMYGRCLPTTSIVTDEHIISKLLTQKSNKQGKWVVRHSKPIYNHALGDHFFFCDTNEL